MGGGDLTVRVAFLLSCGRLSAPTPGLTAVSQQPSVVMVTVTGTGGSLWGNTEVSAFGVA